MSHLKTVPTFSYAQGQPESGYYEQPIQVSYYVGAIELEQGDERVLIHPKYFDGLFKEIMKHRRDADMALKHNK